jgi:phage baseplate assembly protein W
MELYTDVSLDPIRSNNVNEDVLIQSVKNIINTEKGERFFNPEFGTDILGDLKFSLMDNQTKYILKNTLREIILKYDNRIKNIKIEILEYNDLDNSMDVEVFIEPYTGSLITAELSITNNKIINI